MKTILGLLFAIPLVTLTATHAYAVPPMDVTVCDVGGDYATIQSAVNDVPAYSTITVCPGFYDEDVFVNKNGLTIQSTEIPEHGPNTIVRAFSLGFAPSGGPSWVTIKGFMIGAVDSVFVGVCGDGNSVGVESSGNYNTIAFNYVTGCYGPAIRVNQGNFANNVHHNIVYQSNFTGIEIEGNGGMYHEVHHNHVSWVSGEGCIYAWAYNSNVHHNQLGDGCGNGGINAVFSEGNHIHQNELCNESIQLFGADNSHVHQNTFYESGGVINANNGGSGNKVKHNTETSDSCPWVD